jgi:hypothetical protein
VLTFQLKCYRNPNSISLFCFTILTKRSHAERTPPESLMSAFSRFVHAMGRGSRVGRHNDQVCLRCTDQDFISHVNLLSHFERVVLCPTPLPLGFSPSLRVREKKFFSFGVSAR